MLNENGSSSGVVFIERDIESGVFLSAGYLGRSSEGRGLTEYPGGGLDRLGRLVRRLSKCRSDRRYWATNNAWDAV